MQDSSLIGTSDVMHARQLFQTETITNDWNVVFACGSAVEDAVDVTSPVVLNGRRRGHATVTNIRAAVDRSVSIVGQYDIIAKMSVYNFSAGSKQNVEFKRKNWSLKEENVQSRIPILWEIENLTKYKLKYDHGSAKHQHLTCIYQTCFSFWGLCLTDSVPGLRSLGAFVSQNLYCEVQKFLKLCHVVINQSVYQLLCQSVNRHYEHYCHLLRSGYVWNRIISKLFQPSSTSAWNNFISARGNLLEIISKLFHRLIAAHECFPTCSMPLK